MDFIKHLSEKHNIFLNEQQQKAVLNIEGPILLLAVPGGGKTTVIVSRCANMVLNHKIKPENILTLTFSKASAMDMKLRFQKVFGSEAGYKLNFSTIHSFCYNVLRTYTQRLNLDFPTLIEDEKAPITKGQLLRQLYQNHNESFISDDKLDELSNAVCYVKNMMIPDNEMPETIKGIKNFYKIYKSYEAYKTQFNYIDYDDMLTKTLELFKENQALINAYRDRYTYINVDESQDTSYLQHQIIKCVAAPKNNIFMVGDEDQSIYTFRAAFPRALLDFKETYPGAQVYLMENNYRSTKNIVLAANLFIKQNRERYDKNMFSERDVGEKAKYTCLKDKNDQYGYIGSQLKQEKDMAGIAVLYRNNISAIPLADTLHRSNIPFYLREAKNHFFKHWVTTDIISFMNLSFDTADSEAFKQVYYKMNAYLSKAMAEYAVSNVNSNGNLFDILLECPDINGKQATRLLEIKRNIRKISKLKAHRAIEFIVDIIGYGEYLKKQGNNENETTDSLMQIISGLKSIAEKAGSIDDFKNRLEQLQQIMNNARFNKGKNAVTLSTIHSSKGLEFDKVFIIDLFEGQFPSAVSISEFNTKDRTLMEEEVRLFYVGATRARYHLELISAKMLDGKKVNPSRFIEQFLSAYKRPSIKTDNSKWEINLNEFIDGGPICERDLYIQMPVVHKKFGMGNIRFIDPKADLIEISFANAGLKIFSLKACISGNLIHALKQKSPCKTES
jgi:DNA helicase-2/ATP-dependent DNA helicase PcrA